MLKLGSFWWWLCFTFERLSCLSVCIYILISQFLLIREALWYFTIHMQTQLQAVYISIFSLSLPPFLSLSRSIYLSLSVSDSLCPTLFLRLVVGAPVANSTSSPLVKSPGAIYRCDISAEHRRCRQMQSGAVLCAHSLCGGTGLPSLITVKEVCP